MNTPEIKIADTGIVYRNPAPNIHSRHAFFPSVAEMPGGELIVSMDIGSAMENADVRSYLCRSSEGGKTWTEPTRITEIEPAGETVSTSFRMSRTRNGDLLGVVTYFKRKNPDDGLANPKTDGFVETEFAFVRSTDGGATWSEPASISPPIGWNSFETCSPILDTGEGRFLLPTALWKNWEGENPHGMKAVSFISEDEGRTWPRYADVMDFSIRGIASFEQKQIVLSDGRFMAICWIRDLERSASLPNRYTFSEDSGESYGDHLESPIRGETCAPLALANNRILCVYRRTDKKGLWAHLAEIDGKNWKPLSDEPIWGTGIESYGKRSENLFEELSVLRFGYPSLTQLSDGDIFAAFWCFEECVCNIRWFRLRVGA
jgi:hypothetical protein